MTQRSTILQELNEMNSPLVNISTENIYTVPAGYFDGLAATMLNRIKALDAANAVEELNYLSPSISTILKQNIYSVPTGYFENLAKNVLQSIHAENKQETAQEELETLSPLLSGLKKEMPYSIPQGYFENMAEKPVQQKVKVVSITKRKWFRYAAAAVVVGIVAISAFLVFGNHNTPAKSLAKFEKSLNKEIKTMSDDDLNDFIQYSDAGLTGEEKVSNTNTNEVKELLKDIPVSELKEFLEETSGADGDAETTLMN